MVVGKTKIRELPIVDCQNVKFDWVIAARVRECLLLYQAPKLLANAVEIATIAAANWHCQEAFELMFLVTGDKKYQHILGRQQKFCQENFFAIVASEATNVCKKFVLCSNAA